MIKKVKNEFAVDLIELRNRTWTRSMFDIPDYWIKKHEIAFTIDTNSSVEWIWNGAKNSLRLDFQCWQTFTSLLGSFFMVLRIQFTEICDQWLLKRGLNTMICLSAYLSLWQNMNWNNAKVNPAIRKNPKCFIEFKDR